jgi:hypothetical protein
MAGLDLSVEESKFFQEILVECMEIGMKNTPEKPLTSVWSMAWNRFCGAKWAAAIDPSHSLLSPHEYKEIGFTTGPDLVALPRRRYAVLRKFFSRKSEGAQSQPVRSTAYQRFVREQNEKLKVEEPNTTQIEKLRRIAERWRNLPDEAKAQYKADQ